MQTGCPNCARCTNSAVNEAGRKAGRVLAFALTGGMSSVAGAFTANCRGCGHKVSLHQQIAPVQVNQYAAPPVHQPPAHVAPAPQPPAVAAASPAAERLAELNRLLDAGLIDRTEYDAQRAATIRGV